MFFRKNAEEDHNNLKSFYVIDDEEDICELLKTRLEELYPCHVQCFLSADEALKALDDCKIAPDIILSDVRMPGTSGFRLQSAIEEKNLDIPIILITGLSGEEIFEGKKIVISKPFNMKKIKSLIDRLI